MDGYGAAIEAVENEDKRVSGDLEVEDELSR